MSSHDNSMVDRSAVLDEALMVGVSGSSVDLTIDDGVRTGQPSSISCKSINQSINLIFNVI